MVASRLLPNPHAEVGRNVAYLSWIAIDDNLTRYNTIMGFLIID